MENAPLLHEVMKANLSTAQFRLYKYLHEQGPKTVAQASFDLDDNYVSGRLNRMNKAGWLMKGPKTICPRTGRFVWLWRVVYPLMIKHDEKKGSEQLDLGEQKPKEEFKANQPPLYDNAEFHRAMSEATSKTTKRTSPARAATERISGYMSRCIDNGEQEKTTINMGYIQQIIEEECGR